MFTYLVPGADFLSCFAFTRCLTELFMDLFQFGQVQITKDKLDVECVDSLVTISCRNDELSSTMS